MRKASFAENTGNFACEKIRKLDTIEFTIAAGRGLGILQHFLFVSEIRDYFPVSFQTIIILILCKTVDCLTFKDCLQLREEGEHFDQKKSSLHV
jgi:hypothetical protein